MRKVVGYLLMTLDGVVEEPGEWLEHFDEEMKETIVEVINAQDAVLLGRVMYQEWAAYWPTDTDSPTFASFINTVPKYVVSTTLSRVEEWQPATLLKGNISQEIAKLKHTLSERKVLKDLPPEVEKARNAVVSCLRVNDRRPLDCWREVEVFKSEVRKLEEKFVGDML